MKKPLVCFFSVTGNTAKVAHEIAQAVDGTLFEIVPTQPYTKADLKWNNKSSRSSLENANPNSRPEIKNKVVDMDSYDTIFLGFPIWWHTYPKIINTFLDSYNLKGKKIIPFGTSGSSKITQAEKDLKNLLPDCTIGNGQVFNSASKVSVDKWAKEQID